MFSRSGNEAERANHERLEKLKAKNTTREEVKGDKLDSLLQEEDGPDVSVKYKPSGGLGPDMR